MSHDLRTSEGGCWTIKGKLIVRKKKLDRVKLSKYSLLGGLSRKHALVTGIRVSRLNGFRNERWRMKKVVELCLVWFTGQHLKKSSMSESSSEIMELEEGILLTHPEITKKPNCNPRHNNNINPACMSIETDVWLLGWYINWSLIMRNFSHDISIRG